MKTILIAPWAKALRNGKENPKNYPFFKELVVLLRQGGFHTVQVGVKGEADIGADERKSDLSLDALKELINSSFTVISVDSFMQHYCWYIDKEAVVLWGKSDPKIFGHKENINLLKDRKNLRLDQFRWWEDLEYSSDVFVSPEVVLKTINSL